MALAFKAAMDLNWSYDSCYQYLPKVITCQMRITHTVGLNIKFTAACKASHDVVVWLNHTFGKLEFTTYIFSFSSVAFGSRITM